MSVKNSYETVLILNPVLSEEQVKESIDKFNGLLKTFKADLIFKKLNELFKT